MIPGVYVTTGNKLDIVYDFEKDGKMKLVGLHHWGDDKVIPLPNPKGLVDVLQTLLSEINSRNTKIENLP